MNKKEAWDIFKKSGKVEDYLKYKEIERTQEQFFFIGGFFVIIKK